MNRRKIIIIVLEVLLTLVFLFSLVKLTGFDKWLALELSMSDLSDQRPDVSQLPIPETNQLTDKYQDTDADSDSGDADEEPSYDFAPMDALAEQNPDFYGWLSVPGTVIDYPVVYPENNEHYLHRDFNGNYLAAGTLFADVRCAREMDDFITFIYGHNMNNGTMFHDVLKYTKQSFLDENRYAWFSAPDGVYMIEFFACCRVRADSDLYVMGYADEEQWNGYLDRISRNALSELDIGLSYGDHLVCLSTCSYEFEHARTILYGRITSYLPREDLPTE